jgi:eukaryotic-like serine/threonine-protein kinase
VIAKGAQLKDRYRLERLLGRGGMASVWLASDEVLDRPVAIKVLSDTIASDPEFLARFRREARVAASLSHPNLIGVYDYAEGEERPYLVMEYVPGENLAERLAANVATDCEGLARELLGALDHIHAAGIVHRDVKPQNVLIAADGTAKLIDFGIALPKDATSLTRTGNLLGTARYIAPEVMQGRAATERSDLYSCGVVLRDCLDEDTPDHLRALVERLSAADPRRRPASAREALARLGRGASASGQPTRRFSPAERPAPTESIRRPEAGRPVAAGAAPPGRPEPDRPRRPWGKAAALLAVLAALAAVLFVVADDSPQERGGQADRSGKTDRRVAASSPSESEPTDGEEAEEPAAATPGAAGDDPTLGSSLNQEGFELIQAGLYEEAVPVLEEAVRAFPQGTTDLDYAYALYNLGNALRLSGRPEDAIPVLEQRLEIPNQTGIVRRELAAAQREADS